MSRLIHVVRGLVSELKRRKVFRVVGVYAVVAFVVVQVADIVFPALHLPGWTVTLVVALAILGFPIALVLAWALEVTPDGVKRTEPAPTRAPDASIGGRDSRRIAIGLAVGFFLAVAGLGAYGWISSSESGATEEGALEPHRVAVFPFTVRGSPELEYLGESMVELLGRSLDGAGPLRVSDPHALLGRVARESAGTALSPADAQQIAADLGAGRYVLGSVVRVGEEIRLSATWYGGGDEEIASAESRVRGEEEILSGIDALARHIIFDLADHRDGSFDHLAAQTTHSVDALKAYLEGQAAFRRHDFATAKRAFESAVEQDPEFALAHYRLSWAAMWTLDPQTGQEAVDRALELSGDLPDRDRRLLEGFAAYLDGRGEEAERIYRILVTNYPDDWDAWMWLGETLFHFNGMRGRPVTEAREALERAIELDPSHNEPLIHLAQLAFMERDYLRLDTLTSGIEERGLAPGWEAQYLAMRSYALDDGPDDELEGQLRAEDPYMLMLTTLSLLSGQHLQGAEELARMQAGRERPEEVRASGHAWIADMHAARGKLEAAREELELVSTLDRAAYLTGRARLASLPFLPRTSAPPTDHAMLIEQIEGWDAGAVPEREYFVYLLPVADAYPPVRLYLLGLLRAAAGDFAGAREMAVLLEDTPGPALLRGVGPHDFALGIDAEIQRYAGDPEAVLSRVEALEHRVQQPYIRFYEGERERFLRAELLLELGRFDEALGWYGTFDGIGFGDLPYFAPAHLGRARALEALNRPQEAAEAYERFIELWKDADEPLQPKVREARQRLEHLTGGERTVVSTRDVEAAIRALAAGGGIP